MTSATAVDTATTADSPSKKVPCWVCGSDLLFNFANVANGRVAVFTYCPRCKKARTISMTVD